MAAKHGGQRLLGCCFLVFIGVGLFSISVQSCRRSERQRMAEWEQRTAEMRQELFDEVKNGRNNPWVLDAELISMLADDPQCVTNVTSLQFSGNDLSDSRFKRTRDFHQLRGINFYDCRHTDSVLEAISGMPTIITVYFEVSDISDEGIRWLATLPNLKKVQFEQIIPQRKIELLKQLLPDVELVY